MKRASSVAWILLLGTIAFAQNASLTGTWELDTKPSDFGSEPAPKSTSSTVKDTPKMFSFRGHGIDDKGKSFSYSWSGPTDGSMHPTTENGKVTGQSSIRKVGDGFVRHGESTDGKFDGRAPGEQQQRFQQSGRVLAARKRHRHAIALPDHLEPGDCLAYLAEQGLFEIHDLIIKGRNRDITAGYQPPRGLPSRPTARSPGRKASRNHSIWGGWVKMMPTISNRTRFHSTPARRA